MGFLDRLKKAGEVLGESPDPIDEDAFMQDPQGAKDMMSGQGLTKLLRAGAEILPDAEESSIPISPAQKITLFGREINLPEQRFDPSGMIGSVKNIAREIGPAAEALKSLKLAHEAEQLQKLRNFKAGSNVLQAENAAQALSKLPQKSLGRVLVDTGEAAVPNYGKVELRVPHGPPNHGKIIRKK